MEFLDNYTTACDQNGIAEETTVVLMADYLKHSARQEIQNFYVTHDDPVYSFTRCPFYLEAVQHLFVTYATEPVLQEDDAKIGGLTQQPSQQAVEFQAAILKIA